MKKIFSMLLVMLLSIPVISFAQNKPTWPEMKNFHTVMSGTFHPAEEGNLTPLRERAIELFENARKWQESAIPSTFKKEETTEALKQLVVQCGAVMKAVEARASDSDLTRMIGEAHDIFHRIVGECRNADH